MNKQKKDSELVSNRKAGHDYEILDTFEAGIALLGTEIKSLRAHGGSLQDAFIDVQKGELWLLQSNIALYSFGNIHNHEERRPRKLLMHSQEIEKLRRLKAEKGLQIIPLSIYLTIKGIAKVKICTARSKKAHDKRSSIKERDIKRSLARGEE